jgi:hypothetical protein
LQVNPHAPAVHVAVAFAGGAHGEHDAPQLAVLVLSTHVPPQLWKPVLHEIPHATPSHVAVPFAGVEHAVHDAPQLATAVLATHAPPHRW